MFDLKDVNQRKIRQIFRAILRTMRDVAQVSSESEMPTIGHHRSVFKIQFYDSLVFKQTGTIAGNLCAS